MAGSNSDVSSSVDYIVCIYKIDKLHLQEFKIQCKKTASDWNSFTAGAIRDFISLRQAVSVPATDKNNISDNNFYLCTN